MKSWNWINTSISLPLLWYQFQISRRLMISSDFIFMQEKVKGSLRGDGWSGLSLCCLKSLILAAPSVRCALFLDICKAGFFLSLLLLKCSPPCKVETHNIRALEKKRYSSLKEKTHAYSPLLEETSCVSSVPTHFVERRWQLLFQTVFSRTLG